MTTTMSMTTTTVTTRPARRDGSMYSPGGEKSHLHIAGMEQKTFEMTMVFIFEAFESAVCILPKAKLSFDFDTT